MGFFDSESSSFSTGTEQGQQAGKDASAINITAGDDQNATVNLTNDNSFSDSRSFVDNSDRSFYDSSDRSFTDNSDRSFTDNSDRSFTDNSDRSFTDNSQTDNSFTDNSDRSFTDNSDRSFTDNSDRSFTDMRDQSFTDNSVHTVSDFGAVQSSFAAINSINVEAFEFADQVSSDAGKLLTESFEAVRENSAESLEYVSGAFNQAIDQIQESSLSSEERSLDTVLDLSQNVIFALAGVAGIAMLAWGFKR